MQCPARCGCLGTCGQNWATPCAPFVQGCPGTPWSSELWSNVRAHGGNNSQGSTLGACVSREMGQDWLRGALPDRTSDPCSRPLGLPESPPRGALLSPLPPPGGALPSHAWWCHFRPGKVLTSQTLGSTETFLPARISKLLPLIQTMSRTTSPTAPGLCCFQTSQAGASKFAATTPHSMWSSPGLSCDVGTRPDCPWGFIHILGA